MPSEGRRRLRTINTRLRQQDFDVLTQALARWHMVDCQSGYMICCCERALLLRELNKLSQRKKRGEA